MKENIWIDDFKLFDKSKITQKKTSQTICILIRVEIHIYPHVKLPKTGRSLGLAVNIFNDINIYQDISERASVISIQTCPDQDTFHMKFL